MEGTVIRLIVKRVFPKNFQIRTQGKLKLSNIFVFSFLSNLIETSNVPIIYVFYLLVILFFLKVSTVCWIAEKVPDVQE